MSAAQQQPEDDGLQIGDLDVMSLAARMARVPLCGQGGCTRAAGHDEAQRQPYSRSAKLHVVTGAMVRFFGVVNWTGKITIAVLMGATVGAYLLGKRWR
jgi:hypothetical protein